MFSVNAFSLDGVEYAELKIEGKTYNVPLANKKYRDDIYYLKKALAGDEIARDFLLGNKEKRNLFIGDESPLWCVITKDKITVEKP